MSRHQLGPPHQGSGTSELPTTGGTVDASGAHVSTAPAGSGGPAETAARRSAASGSAGFFGTSLRGRTRSRPQDSGEAAGVWLPGEAGEVLLVTGSGFLRAEVERIAAAAGAHLRIAADSGEAARYWDQAHSVLVGSDIRELPPRRRAPAVVVGLDGEGDSLWHLAAALGAERVAVLPDAAAWLAGHLSRARAPGPGGLVLGVTGGCGGAGATTTAIWIAQAAAALGARVLLVDGDPWGGGLELALAAEESPGLRWPDLAEARGSIDSAQLADALPVCGGFAFLSWPASREQPVSVPPATTAGVLEAARRGYELVVVDIGRGAGPLRTFAWDCDRIMVVVPAQLKAAVAAVRLLHELPPVEASLLIRSRRGADLDALQISDAVGLPAHGRLPDVRGVAAATESGRLLGLGRRRRVRAFTAAVLDALGDGLPGEEGP